MMTKRKARTIRTGVLALQADLRDPASVEQPYEVRGTSWEVYKIALDRWVRNQQRKTREWRAARAARPVAKRAA